ncbi:FecR family protein [Pedobacter steynii]
MRVKEPVRLWPRVAAAAAILLVVGAGLFYYISQPVVNRNSEIVNQNDVAPGRNTATITLANGKTIQLSDTKTGVIIDATSLKYNDNTQVNTSAITDRHPDMNGRHPDMNGRHPDMNDRHPDMNDRHPELVSGPRTVQTPRGGTYQITLPDGTKVWLNAASSLLFPSTFQGLGNRKVELSGEAYFEVAKDKAQPFIVVTDKQEVEVLGTHFNINSYAYEQDTKTTLLEGSVRVRPSASNPLQSQSVVLKPGEQSVLNNSYLKIMPVDVEVATAWKNGKFLFRKEKLESILNRLAYWYNVDIVYEGKKPTMLMSGIIERKRNLSSVLEMIKITVGTKFRIEGRKVYVEK